MDARSILATLRQGNDPGAAALEWFAAGLADGRVSDAQAGAFAMAICAHGLSVEGRVALTAAMRDSGEVLDWALPGPVLDKHSTGGVGDCVSLVLAPALAACGAYVPMISGRGLGHTGGTLDKLEAIPGVTVDGDPDRLKGLLEKAGCAIVSASALTAPADRRLYGVRDVTATVESLDLITASILSKKLAAGLEGLVLDVKVGSGAFMKDADAARRLARALVSTANAAGCPTTALVTDMSQPLAPSLGNALEVAEVMQVLTGAMRGPLLEVVTALGGVLLSEAGVFEDVQDAADAVQGRIRSGQAAEKFGQMIGAMGGPKSFVENWPRFLPEAAVIQAVAAPVSGKVMEIDGEALGLAVVALGGGRAVESDVINPAVGLSEVVRLGSTVKAGEPLCMVHAVRPEDAERAAVAIRAAIRVGDGDVHVPDLIQDRIG